MNPVVWTQEVRDHGPSSPVRRLARPECGAEVAGRTLTHLYNAFPDWLRRAHVALDAAVALAYGWCDYTPQMSDEEILGRLLRLNRERAKAA